MTPAPGTAVVVGAGISGLATAQRLAHHGWQVHVLEHAPGPRPQGYMIDFFGPGHEAAQSMGVLPRLRELGHAFARADLVDTHGRARASLRFAHALGGSVVSLLRPDLERALRESLPDHVDLRYECGPHAITEEPDGLRLHLPDGHTLHADLLVGAEDVAAAADEHHGCLCAGVHQSFQRTVGTGAGQVRQVRGHQIAAEHGLVFGQSDDGPVRGDSVGAAAVCRRRWPGRDQGAHVFGDPFVPGGVHQYHAGGGPSLEPGLVQVCSTYREENGRTVTVLRTQSHWTEDGPSFHLDSETGYYYTATVREATAAEIGKLAAHESQDDRLRTAD